MLMKRLLGAVAGLALAVAVAVPAQAEDVVVFAAASTTNAITDAGALFKAKTGNVIVPSFASSSTLAKQIEQGAPAHVFISANEKWADYLETAKLLVPGSRFDLLGNTVVLIASKVSTVPALKIEKGFDLYAALKGGRLAVGDPDHVPVGIYAKQALTSLGVWDILEPHLARMNDVRAALALVERGEAPYGIVYATDAAISDGVKIVGVFPASSHPPVTYPVALVAGHDTAAAKAFMTFLHSPEAKAIFRKYGFTTE